MKTIRIFSESAELGKRLRDILYQAGHTEFSVSGLAAAPQSDILIIYAKSHIPDIIQYASDCEAAVILLLNPDCYAMYLDRARYAGICLLLMPVAPDTLLDAVSNA